MGFRSSWSAYGLPTQFLIPTAYPRPAEPLALNPSRSLGDTGTCLEHSTDRASEPPTPYLLPNPNVATHSDANPLAPNASTFFNNNPERAPAAPKRKNQRAHDYRAAKRRTQREQAGDTPSPSAYAHVLSHGTAIEVNANATEFAFARGAVTGKRGTKEELGDAVERQKFYTIVELVKEHGFEHIPWDGMYIYLSFNSNESTQLKRVF